MTTLYIEPFSGLSGDMLLSAFCALADYYDEIAKLPEQLHLSDGKVEISNANKNGIVCKHVRIIDLNEEAEGRHHHGDQESLHDHHDASPPHPSPLTPHSHDHHHGHRHLKQILEIIENGQISDNAKQIAKDIFMIIGKSEAKIHNMDLEKIHFHEVSAVDSILDIVGCAVLIDLLQVEKTYSEPICTGFGLVHTQHGFLPVPAPATADILMNMPTYPGEEKGERVTPTGAAILKYLNPEFSTPVISRTKIAYGPGQKDFVGPNVVRVSILEDVKKKSQPSQH